MLSTSTAPRAIRRAAQGLVLEGLAGQAADEERVGRPDAAGHGGRGSKVPPTVADHAAGQGHCGACAVPELAQSI